MAILLWTSAIVVLFFIATGLTIGIEYVAQETTYIIFLNMITVSFAMTSVLTIIALRKYFNVL